MATVTYRVGQQVVPGITYLPPVKSAAPIIYYKGAAPPPLTPVAPSTHHKYPDKLGPGEFLVRGECLVSNSQRFKLCFQHDGNVVLTDGTVPVWATNTQGSMAEHFYMQETDGNLVLYDAAANPLWATDVTKGPSYLGMQDDGNAVVYVIAPSSIAVIRGTAVWDTNNSTGYHNWFTNVVAFAGRPLGVLSKVVASGITELGKLASYIPIIGPAIHGILLIASGPFSFTDAVISGARIDKALINDLRDKLTAIREIGPYAQTIVSFIPGIGTGVAMAIGAGLAIAQGRPIDEALLAGLRGAVPGGAAGAAAFDLTYAAATGQNVIQAAGKAGLDALGLPPDQSEALSHALNVVYKASQGENIPMAALQEARSYLPDNEAVQRAYDVGVAMAQGKRLQDALATEIGSLTVGQLEKIKDVGTTLIQNTPAFQSARELVGKASEKAQAAYDSTQRYIRAMPGQVAKASPVDPEKARQAFDLGIGIMRHGGVNEDTLKAVRSQLPSKETQTAFDVAVATYQAAVTSNTVDKTPAEAAPYLMQKGLEQAQAPASVMFQVKPMFALAPAYAVAQGKRDAGKQASLWSWLWSWL